MDIIIIIMPYAENHATWNEVPIKWTKNTSLLSDMLI